ncbi:hypothetical protein LIG30_1456 [Burkholderia sp. lig30]|jgi:hypothetical protein|uniref:hypothetical protein n=1 Tax=Burkholderia sp. lig30 TaxID=1192124 RepID=UPI0004611937|nr:hypothetical protein [Burkholderia sp. lig30]KDB09484.1 hypothetical protein LIG30_1456 [Burkholderia sp. lig30]
MGLGQYASASIRLATELENSLTKEEIASLARDLRRAGLQIWLDWREKNADAIEAFVAATPSERNRRKAWADEEIRRLLTLAAIIHCRQAHAVLDALVLNAPVLEPGAPYRDTTSVAGSIFRELLRMRIPQWPTAFADIEPSPFE